jgi:phosphatidylserine synthase
MVSMGTHSLEDSVLGTCALQTNLASNLQSASTDGVKRDAKVLYVALVLLAILTPTSVSATHYSLAILISSVYLVSILFNLNM